MGYKNFWKTISTAFIYILVAGGALIMLLPFAWMIMTSLKTDSEISQWPPKWTTSNFLSERNIDVVQVRSQAVNKGLIGFSEFLSIKDSNVFQPKKMSFYVNDDTVRRGEVTFTFDNVFVSDNSGLKVLSDKLKTYAQDTNRQDFKDIINLVDDTPEVFEDVYFKLFSSDEGYFKKTTVVRNIYNDNAKFLKMLVDKELSEKIEKILNPLSEFSKGLGIISEDDSEIIIGKIQEINDFIDSSRESITNKRDLMVLNNIYNKNTENINTISFLTYFQKEFKNIQNIDLGNIVLKFQLPDKKIKYENLLKFIDSSDLSSEYKEYIDKNLTKSNVEDFKNIFIDHYEKDYINKIKIYAKLPEDVSKITYIVRNLANNNAYYDDMEEYLPGTYVTFARESAVDKNVINSLVDMRKDLDTVSKAFDTIYTEAISYVSFLQESPYVEKVLYKNNSMFEIFFSDKYSVWFYDDIPEVNAKVSFTQLVANIFQNYVDAWNAAPFSKYYLNTVFMAASTTILEILLASMAAFAFAKFNFWGKNFIFSLFLATMMVPGEVMLVPNYITISRFHWIDSYYALIVPWVVSVFAIFLLRQQFMTIPNDLWDAAKIDGSSSWRFLWTVMVPLSKPSILT
ncbi:MAG TPA: ABC transporter permease subunit, partial [Tepiditoga sp.]|nr:ABC transporter permease subunit [Tepiditoga sp.]